MLGSAFKKTKRCYSLFFRAEVAAAFATLSCKYAVLKTQLCYVCIHEHLGRDASSRVCLILVSLPRRHTPPGSNAMVGFVLTQPRRRDMANQGSLS